MFVWEPDPPAKPALPSFLPPARPLAELFPDRDSALAELRRRAEMLAEMERVLRDFERRDLETVCPPAGYLDYVKNEIEVRRAAIRSQEAAFARLRQEFAARLDIPPARWQDYALISANEERGGHA